MRRRLTRSVAAIFLAAFLLLAMGAVALAAPPWSDASSSYWLGSYGVTDQAVATVAGGYADGTFRPTLSVTRGQFAKMAVSGLDLETANPLVPDFLDVGRSSTFYTFVEGAYFQGLVGGYETPQGNYFKPSNPVTRQQTNSILARYLSQAELDATGVIHGLSGETYDSLQEWYMWEGAFYVNGFMDRDLIGPDHVVGTAYLKFHEIVKGSEDGYLRPTAQLTRAQAAVLVLRTFEVAQILTAPAVPPVLMATLPAGNGPYHWSNESRPVVEGSATPLSEVYVYDGGESTWIAAGYADSTGHVSLRSQTVLDDGMHYLVARSRGAGGVMSAASNTLAYGVDTQAPRATITEPVLAGVFLTMEHLFTFAASATDDSAVSGTETSGVSMVEFLSADLDVGTPAVWADMDVVSSSFQPPYQATYLENGLPNGHYLLAVRATDVAGNEGALFSGEQYAPGVTQEIIVDDTAEESPADQSAE